MTIDVGIAVSMKDTAKLFDVVSMLKTQSEKLQIMLGMRNYSLKMAYATPDNGAGPSINKMDALYR